MNITKELFTDYNESIIITLEKLYKIFKDMVNDNLYKLIKEEIEYYYSKEKILQLELWYILGIEIFLKEALLKSIKDDNNKIDKIKLLIENKTIHKTTINNELVYLVGNELDSIIFKVDNFKDFLKML